MCRARLTIYCHNAALKKLDLGHDDKTRRGQWQENLSEME